MTKTLTPKQQRFVEEYLVDFNGAQAAIRAGYNKRSAKEIASENLTKPNIAVEIEAGMKALTAETELTVQQIVDGMLAETEDKEDGSSSTRISAWSWLGRYKRMWEDKAADNNTQINIHLTGKDSAL